jgi:serine/threonine protein kinase
LWKNIAKAEWPCINRIYDYKTDENNIIVMEKNKSNIVGLPYQNILVDIVKILEFIHDCGYLYRNVEPEHFMLNQDGQLVVIDFKRATRYVDIRGHPVEVVF